MAAMDKVFKCLSCGADIRLERKQDNTGWNKYNLDGSAHVDEKKKGGDVVAVIVRRGTEELTLQVELAARP